MFFPEFNNAKNMQSVPLTTYASSSEVPPPKAEAKKVPLIKRRAAKQADPDDEPSPPKAEAKKQPSITAMVASIASSTDHSVRHGLESRGEKG